MAILYNNICYIAVDELTKPEGFAKQPPMRWVIGLFTVLCLGIMALAVLLVPARDEISKAGRFLPPPPISAPVTAILGVSLDQVRRTSQVPARLYARLPRDMQDVPAGPERKQRFLAILVPLIVKANQDLASDRARMVALLEQVRTDQPLAEDDTQWLMDLALWARIEGERPEDLDRQALLRRVAPVPVSLALAQGAIESGWGSSRFARIGNALYGQWTWDDDDPGIVPANRSVGADHRIRAFNSLTGSVEAYMRNLCTGQAYQEFRAVRAEGGSVYAMAATLTRYSERGQAYVDDLVGLIRSNTLTDFDRARLVSPGVS